jgi:hypothetical protein
MRYMIVIIILIIYRASLVQEQDQGEEWNVRYLTFVQKFICMDTYFCKYPGALPIGMVPGTPEWV